MDLALFNKNSEPTHSVVIDYKSGKVRIPTGWGQLALYALIMFCKYPTLERVDCVYIFVDHNKRYEEVYLKHDLFKLKEFFASQVLQLQSYLKAATTKIPIDDKTPGNCHWCAATPEQCEHSRGISS